MSAEGRVNLELQYNEWMLNLAGDAVWMWMIQVWSCYPLCIARGAMETSAGVVCPAATASLMV